MDSSPKIIMHIIPLISVDKNFYIEEISKFKLPKPLGAKYDYEYRYNFDGLLTSRGYIQKEDTDSTFYLQFFRTGIIETVSNVITRDEDNDNFIVIGFFEKQIIEKLTEYFDFLKMHNISVPILISLNYIRVKNRKFGYCQERFFNECGRYSIEHDIINAPEVLVKEDDIDFPKIMKPIFDTIANASGFKFSFNYTEQNIWSPVWSS